MTRIAALVPLAVSAVGAVSWPAGDPARHGFNVPKLEAARAALAEQGTKRLLIVKDGRIVLEWNSPGSTPDTRHYTASLAKALVGGTSLLLAMTDGRIRPDDRAAKYIPDWAADSRKSKITIRHLATHTSGLQDAKSGDTPHDQLPGWMGLFWKRSPDPFTVALRDAPVLFEPGTQYHYSNTGMAALAYCVTASLRGSPTPDIKSLLRDRVMKPLGISDEEWSIGYDREYRVNDLPLYANWGGGSFTPRAVAKLGEMMLHEGGSVLPKRIVAAALKYAGTPLPKSENAPASGLGWYLNFDGVWPSVPRDAFAGAGAQHQVLLGVPSLKLLVVRNGADLGGGPFWPAAYNRLFDPLMDALGRTGRPVPAPYPPSPVISKVTFSDKIHRDAEGSDNWPVTWSDDDSQYTSYGDGWGFPPMLKQKLGMGMARIDGGPDNYRAFNLRSDSIERRGDGARSPKASGLVSVGGVLYMWVRNTGNAQLVWSADKGRTWEWGFKFAESFGSPSFLNFGRDNAGARDDFIYTYSQDGPSAYEVDDHLILARVPKDRIRDRDAYEFFAGTDVHNCPRWTSTLSRRKPVFTFPGNCQRTDAVYNPGLKRYLLALAYGHHGGWGIYDAPTPWGPWTTAFHTEYWDAGQTHGYRLPSKWIANDGRKMTLIFSGLVHDTVSYDSFCVRGMTLETR
jgi:CubicO group peptidase (beta-lactamase class C family)